MSILKQLVILFIVLISSANCAQNDKSIVVLELFTSQGCSSCPSADKALNEVKKANTNVIVMSYHVDYWNYIGWKDPFSNSKYADKQRFYAQKFASQTIYTPQTVVNGETHFVGSDKTILDDKLKTYSSKTNENTIKLSQIERLGDAYSFNYEVSGTTNNKNLRVVLVINERQTEVNRGENKNRTLSNTNIVVNEFEKPILYKSNSGKSTIKIPETVKSTDKLSLIVLVENTAKDILGGVEKSL